MVNSKEYIEDILYQHKLDFNELASKIDNKVACIHHDFSGFNFIGNYSVLSFDGKNHMHGAWYRHCNNCCKFDFLIK